MALGRVWVIAPLAGMAALALVAGTASADQTVPVQLAEFAYDPASFNVRAGETVHFQLTNDGRFPHDMHVEGNGLVAEAVPGDAAIPSGDSTTFDVTFPRPGTYQVWCPVSNHRERGMTATVEVVAQAAPTQLPRTGDLSEIGPAIAGLGAGLAGLGLFLRRRLASR